MRVLFAVLMSASLMLAADKFSGKWASSRGGVGGTIDIDVADPASVTFTFREQAVKTKVLTLKKEASVIEVRYEFDIDGNKLISTLTGKLAADKFEGKYQTTAAEGDGVVDNGTFTATAR